MNEDPPPFLTFADLMSSVGEFVFWWSLMELGLTKSIEDARKRLGMTSAKVQGPFAERIGKWSKLAKALPENRNSCALVDEICTQALILKGHRNLIVHGLHGGDSQPENGEAHIICVVGGFENPTGKTVHYTIAKMKDLTQGIDACRRAFSSLHNFNHRIASR